MISLLLGAAGGSSPLLAASTIAFKMIAGRPCASGTLQGPDKSIPANVVIDLGSRGSLLVHKNTVKLLQLGPDTPAELRFGDVVLSGLKVFGVEGRDLEELSKEHAEELGEVPAVAVLGLPAFSQYGLRLELEQGRLDLLGPGESIGPADEKKSVALSYEEQGYGVWLTASAGDGFKLRTRFMTSQADTIIDAVAADLAGSAAGAIDQLMLGSINIAKFVALRPEDLSGMPEPRPDVVLGTNLLSSFRVSIDPTEKRMIFEQLREPQFPEQERAYYLARASGDPAGIERYLESWPDSRLAAEASQALLSLRLAEEPTDREAIGRALRFRARTTAENRRAFQMVTIADELIQSEQYELAEKALAIGMESAAADLNGIASFQISARRGLIAMNRNNLAEARRQLVSASFGAPRDPLVNLWLGRFYERTGKPLRAWSRYLQAALDRTAPAEAMVALDGLNRDPAFRAGFSMSDAEQFLEGRILEFHPAERFVEEHPGVSPPVRLVELFTSVDAGGTCGPELAVAGLSEYLEGTPTSFVEYHLSSPKPDPLATRASEARAGYYQTTTAPAAYFDGAGPDASEGSDRHVAEVYAEYSKSAGLSGATSTQTESAGGSNAPAWVLKASAKTAGNQRLGTVVVEGPASNDNLRIHVLLCEKRVMLPGANGVMLHRNVVRALLSPEEGFVVPGGANRQIAWSASLDKIASDLETELAKAEKSLEVNYTMRPTYVDRSALVVTAFLQERTSRKVLAAISLDVGKPASRPAEVH